jgi:hypothetical protein
MPKLKTKWNFPEAALLYFMEDENFINQLI